jgi:RimJ/RimL family protein N-acetyltransferase
MGIDVSLFEGKAICLAPIDHDKDAAVESRWTHDAEYQRLLETEPARPLSAFQVKKRYEAIEKEMDEDKNLFYFTIRLRAGQGQGGEADRLVGFARLYWIEWAHGNGNVQLGIGEANDRGHGYGTEALGLLMRFAFDELNLYRLSAMVPEYNTTALRLFERAGFVEEVHRRQALQRDGRCWDLIHVGILRDEWQMASGSASRSDEE